MTALPSTPPLSYGTRLQSRRKIIEQMLGDGYSARARKGVNSVRQQWELTWDNVTDEEVATLRDFFETLGAVDNFTWTPPNQDVELKWVEIADSFSADAVSFNNWNVKVSVRQVFDV